MLIASMPRQVPKIAPRILFTSKESIASKLARSVMEGAGSRGLRRRTKSRFHSALATRINGQHTPILILRRGEGGPGAEDEDGAYHPSREATPRAEHAGY